MITVYQTGTPSVVNQSTRGWGTLRGRPEGAPLPLVALLRLLEEVGVEVLFKERVILLAVVSNLVSSNKKWIQLFRIALNFAIQNITSYVLIISISARKERCRDFDEKGYCLRGGLCPYDHGMDPVVVEESNLSNVLQAAVNPSNNYVTPTPPSIYPPVGKSIGNKAPLSGQCHTNPSRSSYPVAFILTKSHNLV